MRKLDMKSADMKTKQLIVPAKYILGAIADSPNTKYPMSVSVLVWNGGASYQISNREELMNLCAIRDVYQSSLMRLGKKDGRFIVELCKDARLTVHRDTLPERRHMETLVKQQAYELFSNMYT